MTTATTKPAFDLDYSIDDFVPSERRDSQYLYRALEDAMVELATGVPGARVLDVACGTGKQAMRIAARGCTAVGIEASAEMIGVGRWLQPQSEARMLRSLAESLPFADGSFERVICQGSLDHFADPHAFMREAARVLTPDGRLVIALANFEGLSCRLGRLVDATKRRLQRPRPPWRLYWETPEDHNVRGDLPFVRSLGGDALVLERCVGMSMFWLFGPYSGLLDALPERAAGALWRALDRAARSRPQHADMIISTWRRTEAGTCQTTAG
ncbi:MAG: class I SAM-dependent methyltransferase [Dehalococcoidia bacterium]|nr:class I SAM-dependent methyltransferase [Dehalococcoidia bacterium]